MPATVLLPLQRLVTRNSWLQQNSLLVIAYGAQAAMALLFWLVSVTLLADLLIVRGAEAEKLVTAAMESGKAPLGLLPDPGLWVQAIRFGDLSAWRWLPWICETLPLLRTTPGAVFSLVLFSLLMAGIYSWSRNRARVAAARAARDTATKLRNNIHRQALRLGPSDLTGQNQETAIQLFCDEVEVIRECLGEWRWRYVRARFLIPTLVLTAIAIDWRLGLECLVPAVACWWVFRYEREKGAENRQIAEAHAETEVQFLSEGLRQTRLVRGYNMEEFERSLFQAHLNRMSEDLSQGRQLERAALTTARFVTWAGMAIIVLLIAIRVTSAVHPLPLSNGVVLGLILLGLTMEWNSWERLENLTARLNVAGERVYTYLDEIPQVGQAVGAKFIDPVSKSIILEAVHYVHQGNEILRGVDLRIEANSEISLVGMDPLAPKAVAYLIARFIEPTRGRVLFDGEDIAWGTLESIHSEVLYIGSDDPILSGTVVDNILCGDKRYSLPDAIEAAKEVHANKFITQLPNGYETLLGEQGHQLSAGEAFRIGLARAVIRQPAVIIIEEPKVILDENTRALIDDAYQRLANKRTLIYLPSRLSTIRRCGSVHLFHEGVLAAVGTHQDLAKKSELYRHWDYVTFNTYSRQSRRLVEVS
ncbi:MAG: ABC transporter ATP-binding protein [Planctomycetaceae bacterium]|nr:ABC transporter ATP-binding protein [Planctomycetaceae bacterium]